jgi:hypothetical protein
VAEIWLEVAQSTCPELVCAFQSELTGAGSREERGFESGNPFD